MDFMDFSFSNSTYTALLALFAAIFGVGYPLIIQAIGEIDKKYDSTLLLKCFEEGSNLHFLLYNNSIHIVSI